ncbi:MAG TPA: hypothetical protein VKU01_09110 [Bryobacteraceae bacterium]|nr:hypothetical protein [Bryobacteraceae bacterium]
MSHVKTLDAPRMAAGRWSPKTEEERQAVLNQLEHVLSTPYFKNSKRYPGLLRFVTERALSGEASHLKERSLGVAVFGRDPDYDTNLDPVVRITAAEIRKRLAQYYQEPGHENEIRIDFPAGSYTPEFQPQKDAAPPAPPARALHKWVIRLAIPAALVVTMGAAVSLWPQTRALDRFWAPVWDSSGSALLCLGGAGLAPAAGTQSPALQTPAPAVTIGELQRQEYVAFADAVTLAMVSGLFSSLGKPFHIRRHGSADLDELRYGPAVLIGAYNNSWTMRLAREGRFGFEMETNTYWIRDRQKPGRREWIIHSDVPYRNIPEDYGLICRMQDPITKRTVVVAAGLTKFGTRAAGEFITDPSYMQAVTQEAPRDWYRKNIQIVIATKLVGENSGPPRVVATFFW